MKQTINYNLPYPECDPPLSKDMADLPRNLFNLATAAETEFDVLDGQIQELVGSVPSGELRQNGQQALATDQVFDLPTEVSAVNVGVIDLSTFVIQQNGLYLIVGYAATSTGPGQWHRLVIQINDTLGRASSVRPATGGYKNNVVYPRVLNVGDRVNLSQSAPATLVYDDARLSLVRILAL